MSIKKSKYEVVGGAAQHPFTANVLGHTPNTTVMSQEVNIPPQSMNGKMKVALLCTYSNIQAFGLRMVSASLKRAGHETIMIFLPQKFSESYSQKSLDAMVALVAGCDVAGFSLMSNHYDNTVQLTKALRMVSDIPIIWGGVHPTIRPEECLAHADIVCLGDAEETVVELIGRMGLGQDYSDIEGLWLKKDGEIIENPLRHLLANLDTLPLQDINYETHFLVTDGKVSKIGPDLLGELMSYDYLTQPNRGCPFKCSFCCNNPQFEMYEKDYKPPSFRERSIDNIIDELVIIKNTMPFLDHVKFDDDVFFFLSEEKIEEFCTKYKEHVDLPLDIGGTTPSTLSKRKMELLIDAGMVCFRMGIQTAAERTKRLYKRGYSDKKILQAAHIINEFKATIRPIYDIILNNPWEEDEDLAETLILLAKIPAPFELNLFSLSFYPGTGLHDRAVEEGLVVDLVTDVYRKSYNLTMDGTSGELVDQGHMNNLFFMVHVLAKNNKNIPVARMAIMADRKRYPIRGRIYYFFTKQIASYYLKKNLISKIWQNEMRKITGDRASYSWFDDYAKD